MSSNLFKTKYLPNYDGSNSATVLNDSNTAFIHTYIGDDSTCDGTRAYPYRSMGKALLKGMTYIVFRGVINEPFSTNTNIVGDDINQIIIGTDYSTYNPRSRRLTTSLSNITYVQNQAYGGNIYTGNISTNSLGKNNLFKLTYTLAPTDSDSIYNDTINNLIVFNGNTIQYGYSVTMRNSIVIGSLNILASSSLTMTYCVFSTSTIFKYNGTTITTPTWTNDSKTNMGLLKTALLAKGMSLSAYNLCFPVNGFGEDTCRIIWENRNGGTHPNIFNKYDGSGNVLDWTLNPDMNNESLFCGDTGGFVGCFRPTSAINSTSGNALGNVVDVDVNGNDTVNVADLMVKNIDDTISFQTSATSQTWNRLRGTSTITIPGGRVFKGINGITLDGSPFGHYIGKHQNIMDVTHINEGGTLTTGYTYKVCSTVHDITHAIIYNGVQYLPDYFFKCIAGVTSFSLVSSGSGAYLQRVLCDPLESIEIIPYSDVNNVSGSYPKFSAPIGTSCLMLQYSATNGYGKVTGTPVLFGDYTFCTELASIRDKISYYDGFAVTNADQEFYSLVGNSKFITAAPILNYLRVEVNGHFNAAYNY